MICSAHKLKGINSYIGKLFVFQGKQIAHRAGLCYDEKNAREATA